LAREGSEETESEATPGKGSRLPISSYRLPPGVHGLSRQYVVGNQRWRLAMAAAELLAENGSRRLTMHAIAARAAIAPGVAYRHFRDPTAVIAEAFRLTAVEVRERIEGSCAAAEGGDGAVRGLEAVSALLATDKEFVALFGWEAAAVSVELAAVKLQMIDEFAHRLAGGRRSVAGEVVEVTRLRLEGVLALLVWTSERGCLVSPEELEVLLGANTGEI
jgi:AcrR family transcriptional regulator